MNHIFLLTVFMSMIGAKAFANSIQILPSEHGTVNCEVTEGVEGQEIILTIEPDEGYALKTITITATTKAELSYTDKKPPKIELNKNYSYAQLEAYYSNTMMLFFGTEKDPDKYAIRMGIQLNLRSGVTKEFINSTVWQCVKINATPYRFIPAPDTEKQLTTSCVENNKYSFIMIDGDVVVRLEFEKTTGIISIENEQTEIENATRKWYTIGGQRLKEKPTKSGVYINGNKKIIINNQ